MKIGFIGAGKVGFSLGKYFTSHELEVVGYYDENTNCAREASEFTNTNCYNNIDDLIEISDVLFLTVPDGKIISVWEKIKNKRIKNKIICHCSGVMSHSAAFSEIDQKEAFGYSIHPLFAVNDKYKSYKELSNTLFTIEGNKKYLYKVKDLLESLGNKVQIIKADQKIKYHTAAAICSNHVIALVKESIDMLIKCGFEKENAECALAPIMRSNMEHIINDGIIDSLTGPIERNDISTVTKHLECLESDDRLLYILLSEKLVEIAKNKHGETDYTELDELLLNEKQKDRG